MTGRGRPRAVWSAGALLWVGAALTAWAHEPIAQTMARLQGALEADRNSVRDWRATVLWPPDEHAAYVVLGSDPLRIQRVGVGTGEVKDVASAAVVRRALSLAGIGEEALRRAVATGVDADGTVLFRVDGVDYEFVPAAARARLNAARATRESLARARVLSDQFPTTFGNLVEARSPDARWLVLVRNHDLWLRSAADGQERRLTSDGTPRTTWENTQESAQSFNVLWASDSRRIAAVQLDTTRVWYEPLPRFLRRAPVPDLVAYPRAGDPIHDFRLAVIDVRDGRRVSIQTGNTTQQYVDLLAWDTEGRGVYYQTIDRAQKHLTIWWADASTGIPRRILEERAATYIETPMTLGPTLFHPLPGGDFLYLSESSGLRQIYRHSADGSRLHAVTQAVLPVEDVVHIDPSANWVYYRAAADPARPYERRLHRARLDGRGSAQRLGPDEGDQSVEFSPSGRYVVLRRSTPQTLPVTELRRADGSLVAALTTATPVGDGAMLPEALERFEHPSIDRSAPLYGVIAKPPGFDPGRRYPVVEFIYGGMQAVQQPRRFFLEDRTGSNPVLRALLHSGFVVVMMDAPGTPGRGRAFRDATYGRWPQGVVAEHLAWIRAAAATRPWMDLERLGIYGHSWGGYLAQRAMIDAPGAFKAAAAHAAPSDFVDHPTYIEPFMGMPWDNPDGYEQGSNLTRVGAIQGPVLVMPMPLDVNAGFSPGLKFVDAMMNARKDVELVISPDSNHVFGCCTPERELYMTATVLRFLQRHLADGSGP